jgi:hypothetical protein
MRSALEPKMFSAREIAVAIVAISTTCLLVQGMLQYLIASHGLL